MDNRPPEPGPTALRMQVGARLRELREARGISREEAGERIRASNSKMSRLERGRHGFKIRDVADLLELYVADDEDRETLLALAEQAKEPAWWQAYSDVIPSWFGQYLGLEQSATVIRSYEPQVIPALLQTPDYARAAVRLEPHTAHDVTAEDIERRVELRMARQEVLRRDVGAATLWTIVDEAALRRPMGGRDVMHGQLARLVEEAERPNVNFQVMSFAAGGHPALGGPITVLRFAENHLPDTVYLEHLSGASYPEKHEAVTFQHIMNSLAVQADHPADSIAFVKRLLDEC
jgi:transcriptional regulator with XRE-family HTH domain